MAKKIAPKTDVIVTIDDTHVDQIDKVTTALEKAGLSVGQVLSMGGVITGKVTAAKMQQLRLVEGVKDVESDGEMHAL